MIPKWLRQALLPLLLLIASPVAHAASDENLPVTIVPDLVKLGWNVHAVFSRSSRLIVTDNNGLYIWDIGSRRLVRKTIFDTFARWPRPLAASEDLMITGHADGKVRLWNLANGAAAGVLEEKAPDGHAHEISALAISADGALLVSGSDDGTISVWNLKTHQKARSLNFGKTEGSDSRILALRLTKDQKRLIAATRALVRTFDLGSGVQLTDFLLPSGSYFADSIVSDDGLIAEFTVPGCDFTELKYLDLRDPANTLLVDKPADCKRKPEDIYKFELGNPSLFVNASRTSVLVARSGFREIREWDLKTRTVTRTITWPDGAEPEIIGVDNDFTHVASDIDNHPSVRELENGAVVAAFDTTIYPADAAIRSRDGKSILLAQQTADKSVEQLTLWEVGAAAPKRVLRVPADGDTLIMDFTEEANLAASVTRDGFVLLSLETGKEVRRWTQREIDTPSIIRISGDGKLALLSGGWGNESVSLLVDTSDGSVRQRFSQIKDNAEKEVDNDNFSITDAAFSRDGKRLALGRNDGSAEIWDVASLKRVSQLPADKDDPGQLFSLVFSADGKKLLACGGNADADLWTIDFPRPPRVFAYDNQAAMHPYLASAALSHDGSMVAAGSALRGISSGDTGRERGVRIWNAGSGKLRLSWFGHDDGVRTVTFSPDDRILISASRDGTIKYWDTGSGNNIATILVSNDGHWAVLSPSGLYSADRGDSSLFGFARGLSARPPSDFKDKLYRPDLITELLKGDLSHRYAAAAKQLDLKKLWDETR